MYKKLGRFAEAKKEWELIIEALISEYQTPEEDNDIEWAKREIAQLEQLLVTNSQNITTAAGASRILRHSYNIQLISRTIDYKSYSHSTLNALHTDTSHSVIFLLISNISWYFSFPSNQASAIN